MSQLDHDLRKGRITSSVAAACLGLDPWCTPMQAWEKITGRIPFDEQAPIEQYEQGELDPRERGRVLETALMDFAQDAASSRFRRRMDVVCPSTVALEQLPWAADSVDALLEERSPDVGFSGLQLCVEGKSVAFSAPDAPQWGTPWTDDVPTYVKVQSLWHLLHWPGAIATLVPTIIGAGLTMRVYLVPFDKLAADSLVNILGQWHHRHVQTDTPPPARAGDEETIRRLFPRPTKPEHPDDPAIAELCMLDVGLRQQMNELSSRREETRAELASRLRDYALCQGDWGRVTYGMQKFQRQVNYKAVYDEVYAAASEAGRLVMDGLLEKHTKPAHETRALRTYGKHGE